MKKNVFLTPSKIILMMCLAVSLVQCDKNDDPDVAPSAKAPVFTEKKESLSNSAGGIDQVSTVTVKDLGEGVGTMTWTKDKVWILDGLVFVNKGQTLTIEPGTIIKGKAGQGEEASALVVARGAKMIADGTRTSPIIMTAYADNLTPKDISEAGQGGRSIQGSLKSLESGLWGGLIVLGNAKVNEDDRDLVEPGDQEIVNGVTATELRALFGGNDDNDNSGTFRYISVRHGGTEIAPANEINGWTFAGVGSGTIVEYIESYSNSDDGIEIFGGTVNLKHVIAANCGDDAFDFDSGWRGSVQFLVAYEMEDTGGEHDGADGPDKTDAPFNDVKISNLTLVGRLQDASGTGRRLMTLRQNAGAKYQNSIFCNFQFPGRIDVDPTLVSDAYRRFKADECYVKNSLFYNIAGLSSLNDKLYVSYSEDKLKGIEVQLADAQTQINSLIASVGFANNYGNPTFKSVDPTSLDFLVPSSSEVTTSVFNVNSAWGAFFTNVNYKGAFNPAGDTWANKWSYLGALKV